LDEIYDGNVTFGELKKHGDLGLGTFNNLDGEMIGIDGEFYQIKADEVAYPVDDSMKTQFAVVTFFESDETKEIDKSVNYDQLKVFLNSMLPTENIFYAFKIEGTFEFHDIKGTLVGSWFPDYMKGINIPGYHFHFITEDKKAGGHLLECQTENIRIGIDYTSNSYLELPENEEFYNAELFIENRATLEKVEK